MLLAGSGTLIHRGRPHVIPNSALNPSFLLDATQGSSALVGSGLAFTRASGATVQAYGASAPVAVSSNELRFDGFRRVQNQCPYSQNFAGAGWTASNTSVATGVTDPLGGTTAATVTATANNGFFYQTIGPGAASSSWTVSVYIRRRTGTGTVGLADQSTGGYDVISAPTGTWQRMTNGVTTRPGSAGTVYLAIQLGTSGDQIDIAFAQIENVTGYANTNPSEYLATNTLSSPYYGAFVDGVQYFPYQNGNTVTSNVVTAGTGATIATLKGINEELAATNYFLNSTAPVTQNVTLPTGTFIVWMYGSGSVTTSAGTATASGYGVASNSGTDWYTSNTYTTLVVTVAGNVAFTCTGCTFVQCESSTNGFPTSPIITAGASATRAQDVWTAPKANVSGYSSTQGWFQAEVILPFLQGVNIPVWGSDAGDTPLGFNTSSDARTFNGTTATATANAATALAVTKLAMTYGTGPTESVCLNAGTVASSANAFLGPTTTFQLYGGGARWTRKLRFGAATITAAQLQTVTGSTY